MNKDFSVLMSVYRNDNSVFLEESLKSIINQTISPTEIIIVCDGPISDSLNNVIESFTNKNHIVKVIRLEVNCGLGLALKEGMKHITTSIVARMDADDICNPKRFELELEHIAKGYDLVGSNTIEFENSLEGNNHLRYMPETHNNILEYSKKRNPFIHPSVMFKKEIYDKTDGYRDFYLVEDYDLWIRMIMSGAKCYNIQENLVYMRVNSTFYERRGGYKYFKSINRFFRLLRKKKYITFIQYSSTIIPRFIVYNAPNSIRRRIYVRKLRG